MTEHRCRRGDRCADRERVVETPRVCEPEPGEAPCGCHDGPGKPCTLPGGCGALHREQIVEYGAPIPTPDGLCGRCTSDVTTAIRHLKGDVAELTMLIGRAGSAQDDKISRTRELPVPIRLGVEALRAEIDHQTDTWAEIVAEQLGIDWATSTGGRATRMGPRVTRAVDLLTNTVDVLVTLGPQELSAWDDGEPVWDHHLDCQDTTVMDGVDAALHLQHLHWRAYRIAGRTRLVHRLLARCEHCGQRQLVRDDGDEDARCESERCRGRRVPAGRLDWLHMATIAVEKAAHEEVAA